MAVAGAVFKPFAVPIGVFPPLLASVPGAFDVTGGAGSGVTAGFGVGVLLPLELELVPLLLVPLALLAPALPLEPLPGVPVWDAESGAGVDAVVAGAVLCVVVVCVLGSGAGEAAVLVVSVLVWVSPFVVVVSVARATAGARRQRRRANARTRIRGIARPLGEAVGAVGTQSSVPRNPSPCKLPVTSLREVLSAHPDNIKRTTRDLAVQWFQCEKNADATSSWKTNRCHSLFRSTFEAKFSCEQQWRRLSPFSPQSV